MVRITAGYRENGDYPSSLDQLTEDDRQVIPRSVLNGRPFQFYPAGLGSVQLSHWENSGRAGENLVMVEGEPNVDQENDERSAGVTAYRVHEPLGSYYADITRQPALLLPAEFCSQPLIVLFADLAAICRKI